VKIQGEESCRQAKERHDLELWPPDRDSKFLLLKTPGLG
jgi:hypothetical protein